MMKGMFKRALGVVAAAAMAVTGMAALSGTANAAESELTAGTAVSCDGGVSFEFDADDANRLKDAQFTVYKLADYIKYTTTSDSLYGVETAQAGNGLEAIKTALHTSDTTYDADADPELDPMAWLMGQQMSTWQDDGTWGYVNGVADSNVRKFAEALDTHQLTSVDSTNYIVGDLQGGAEEGYSRTISGLEAGVYLFIVNSNNSSVTSTVPMIVSTGKLTGTGTIENPCEVAPVEIKNNVLADQTKDTDADSASIGDVFSYTLSGQVPATAVDDFKFVDRPGVGLTVIANSIKVYATDEAVTDDNKETLLVESNLLGANIDYSVSWNDLTAVDDNDQLASSNATGYKAVETPVENANQTFEVALTNPGAHQTKYITVVYDVRVNDDVDLEKGIVNELNNKGEWVKSQTRTQLHEFTIDKRNTDHESIPDVTFTVKDEDDNALYFVPMTSTDQVAGEGDAVAYYKKAAHSTTMSATTNLVTNAQGQIVLKGLGDDVYHICETDNGDGYINVYADFKVTISNGVVSVTEDDANDLATSESVNGTIVTVLNARSITELPKTGAAGVTMFVVLGLLIAGAGVTVYMKSRNVRNAMRA